MKNKFLVALVGLAIFATSCANNVDDVGFTEDSTTGKTKKLLPETRGVKVTPSTVSLYAEQAQAFVAQLSNESTEGEDLSGEEGAEDAPKQSVDTSGGGTADVEYEWSITKKTSNGTTITERGVITLGADEKGPVIVRAASKADGSLWGTAVITVKSGSAPKPIPAYTVTFDLNGGTSDEITPIRVSEGDSVASTIGDAWEDPVNDSPTGMVGNNYYLAAWNTEANGSGADWGVSTAVTQDIKVYAIWRVLTADRSALSFDTMGVTVDTAPETLLVITNSTVSGSGLELPLPTSGSFDFKGWHVDKNLTTPFNEYDIVTTRLMTVYARWETKNFSVEFDTHGGNEIQKRDVGIGSLLVNLVKPTKESAIFDNWYKDYNETTGVYSNPWQEKTDTVTSNITLHAKWIDIITYTVTFESKEGSPDIQSKGVDEGSTVQMPQEPKREGYFFSVWADSKGKEWNFSTPVTGEMTLYATWLGVNENVRKVIFVTGEGASSIDDRSVVSGSTITTPVVPTKESAEFTGWYKEAELINQWNFEKDKVTADTTLYAKWRAIIRYEVSFNINGATSGTLQSYLVESGNHIIAPNSPVSDKGSFAGWYFKDTPVTTRSWDFATDTVTSAVELFATWSHTVTFISNLGTSVAPINAVSTGSLIRKPLADPTRGGAEFVGWYKNVGLTSAWDWDSDTVTENTTLYALWQHKVTFNTNGGNPSEIIKTVYSGKTVAAPSVNPTKDSARFDVWCKDSKLQNEFDFTRETITTDTIIHARWIQQNTVKFNTNGATSAAIADQTITTGGTVTRPTQPTKTNADFGGWYMDSTLTTAWDFKNAVTDDMTLYVRWTHDVTFNPGNGGTATLIKVIDGRAVSPLNPEPTYRGHVFSGWYNDATNSAWNFTTPVTTSLTLSVKWTKLSYTVSFNTDGGTSIANESVEYGDAAIRPIADPQKTGAEFKGWFSDSAFRTPHLFTEHITSDTTIYAKFEWNVYDVTFDVNGGTAVGRQRVTHGYKVSKPESTKKDGAGFGGWYKDVVLAIAWDFDTDVVTGNVTIHAKWNDNLYAVEFDTDEGTAITTQYISNGSAATRPTDPTKNGYTFGGWYKAKTWTTEWNFTNDKITKDTTIYAKFVAGEFTVSFRRNDGNSDDEFTKRTVKYGNFVSLPADPAREGYTFEGWFLEASGDQIFNNTTEAITSNLYLYAKWTANTYTIYFNDGNKNLSSQPKQYKQTINPLPTPTKDGFTFDGWYSKTNGEGERYDAPYTVPVGGQTLYANWSTNKWKVTFYGGDGDDVSIDPPYVNEGYGVIIALPTSAKATKVGYTLKGWYPSSTAYEAEKYTNYTVPNRDSTVYAKWTVNTYTIAYSLNGGTEDVDSPNPVTYTIETDTITLAPLAKSGYIFGGWYTNSSFSGNAVTTIAKGSTGDKSFYAKFNERTNMASGGNVTIVESGGVSYEVHKFTADGALNLVRAPEAGTVDILVVAGGGGGGGTSYADFGGGGGAGGYKYLTGQSLSVGSTAVIVGAGGTGGTGSGGNANRGLNGGNSKFGTIESTGGGGGGGAFGGEIAGNAGGSGGGGAAGDSNHRGAAGSGTTGQGYGGGTGFGFDGRGDGEAGGGGGGATGAGATSTNNANGAGGAGASNSITGSAVTYATGGSAGTGTAGAANTGNGGASGVLRGNGGAGGSGIVIVRFPHVE